MPSAAGSGAAIRSARAIESTVEHLQDTLGPEEWEKGRHPEIPETKILDNPYQYTSPKKAPLMGGTDGKWGGHAGSRVGTSTDRGAAAAAAAAAASGTASGTASGASNLGAVIEARRRSPVERARVAVALVFALNGVVFASWVSRLPAVRDALSLSTGELGLLLLCLSVGSVIGLPTSGPLVARFGPARAALGGVVVVASGLLLAALGLGLVAVPLVGAGLGLTGLGIGVWDVAMNVEGADVERRLGRALMPRFHAGFSLGTVAGALVGAGAAAAGVDVQVQLAGTAVAAAVGVATALRAFLPVAEHRSGPAALTLGRAWQEPRTLLIGLLVLCFAFVEGTANDWLAVALVDGHGTSEAMGALGFAVFVAAMTAVRTVAGPVLARHGRTAVLRATAATAVAGLLLVVLATSLPLVLLGALLWGAGAALGFPVGMSAAADDPHGAAVRVSVVSSIGYTAFLAGPPLIGLLAEPERLGVLPALLVVLVALVVGGAVAPRAAPAPAGEPLSAAGRPTAGGARRRPGA